MANLYNTFNEINATISGAHHSRLGENRLLVENDAVFNDTLTVDGGTLFVNSSNNKVGIGTTTPTEKLTVIGNISGSANITSQTLSTVSGTHNLNVNDFVYIKDASDNSIFSTEEFQMWDSLTQPSIGWDSRVLIDASGITSLDWSNRTNINAPSQTASSSTSLMTRQLVDSLLTDTSVIYYRDDFVGVVDTATVNTLFGELSWVHGTVGTAGVIRSYNISPSFGVIGINTGAARRSSVIVTWDISNVGSGVGGFQFQGNALQNSSTVYKTRFRINSLDCTIGLGFSQYNTTAYKVNRFFGLRYAKPSQGWNPITSIALNEYVRPFTAPNGRRYYASTAGTTGSSEPTWPTTAGATVSDGTVVWTENGLDGNTDFILQDCPNTSNELLSTTVDTNIAVAIDTWYEVVMTYVSGSTWNFTINGTNAGNITMSSDNRTNSCLPVFKIENSRAAVTELSVDYFMLFSRGITR